jgi:hypothetical protein
MDVTASFINCSGIIAGDVAAATFDSICTRDFSKSCQGGAARAAVGMMCRQLENRMS